jgi:hypothetical protein
MTCVPFASIFTFRCYLQAPSLVSSYITCALLKLTVMYLTMLGTLANVSPFSFVNCKGHTKELHTLSLYSSLSPRYMHFCGLTRIPVVLKLQ